MLKINKLGANIYTKVTGLLLVLAVIFAYFLVIAPNAFSQSVLQGYNSEENLQKGMLIALKEDDETKIVAITDKNVDKFKGVVVDKNDSPVTISSEDQKFFVASVGPYEVLVTDEYGSIKRGDYIGVSTSSGIGAKATEFQEYVIGVAASDFNGGGDSISTAETAGRKVNVGRIKVDVALTRNPNLKAPEKDRIPDAIQKLARSVADKPVSNVKIYVAIAIFLATAAISGTMLYSGVRNAIISIGRNPLSKASIYKGLLQVIIMSLIIFIVGIFGVYLLLKL